MTDADMKNRLNEAIEKNELLTVGQLADFFEDSPSRISYVISKYRLKPANRVGIIRQFDASILPQLKEGLYNLGVRN